MVVGTIGELVDSTGVADARIFIKGTQLEQRTDQNGAYVFEKNIPIGEQVLSISKPGYEPREIEIYIVQGKKLVMDRISLLITSKERRERNKEAKQLGQEKIKKKEVQEPASILGKIPVVGGIGGEIPIIKGAFKKKKSLDEVTFTYEDIPKEIVVEEPVMEEPSYSPLQLKYSKLMDVPPEEIANLTLYEFIDEWMGTPYVMGGNTERGIDCSAFALRLYNQVYDTFPGRTAQQMLDDNVPESTNISLFEDPYYLKEGDLMFFNAGGERNKDRIEHVGVYLTENKFINATSRNGKTGVSGVKISDLNDAYWMKRFRAGGRVVE